MKLETVRIGRIVAAHGIRGEVRVQPLERDPAFLASIRAFLLDGKEVRPSANRVHKNVALMKFPGTDDMNAALDLVGKTLSVRRGDAPLPASEAFDGELLGVAVFSAERGERLGEITAVEHYPASDVYTVKGAREYLIPAVKDAFIVSLDLENNRMVIHEWEGLASDEH